MILEIALGLVLGVILLALLPLILVLAWYAFLFALALAFLGLLGWGAYELWQELFGAGLDHVLDLPGLSHQLVDLCPCLDPFPRPHTVPPGWVILAC